MTPRIPAAVWSYSRTAVLWQRAEPSRVGQTFLPGLTGRTGQQWTGESIHSRQSWPAQPRPPLILTRGYECHLAREKYVSLLELASKSGRQEWWWLQLKLTRSRNLVTRCVPQSFCSLYGRFAAKEGRFPAWGQPRAGSCLEDSSLGYWYSCGCCTPRAKIAAAAAPAQHTLTFERGQEIGQERGQQPAPDLSLISHANWVLLPSLNSNLHLTATVGRPSRANWNW